MIKLLSNRYIADLFKIWIASMVLWQKASFSRKKEQLLLTIFVEYISLVISMVLLSLRNEKFKATLLSQWIKKLVILIWFSNKTLFIFVLIFHQLPKSISASAKYQGAFFVNVVNSFYKLTIFTKGFIVYISQGPK